MRFLVLGCGTSTGVPMPGCQCAVCTSNNPRNWRDRTSALLTTNDGRRLLIDASPDLRYQALKHSVPSVDAVFYTHAHADHMFGTDDLRSFNFVHRSRIPCYGTGRTLERIRSTFSYIFDQDASYEGGLLAQLDPIEVSHFTPIEILGARFTFVPLQHGRMEVTGFRVGSLGYATDFKQLSADAEQVLTGCKYLFLDALRY